MKREVQNDSSAPARLTHFKKQLCQSLQKTENWRYPLVNLVGAVLILLSLIAAWKACRDNRDFLGSDKRLRPDEKTRRMAAQAPIA
jgi:hypothetical protein